MTEKEIACWACMEKSGEIKQWKYQARPLGPKDVEIRIFCCGICGSDVHQMDSGWGEAIYPIVPGHEIIGEIIAVGTEVTRFKIGQRAGVGAQCWSCGECNECKSGNEQLCEESVFTYNSTFMDGSISYGGYSTGIRVDERFAFLIPENLPSEQAAPLLCAGTTVFSPMRQYGVKEGTKLGVIGIGGLGHLAIKFGKALGAEVTAISHKQEKEKDSIALGATRFIYSGDRKQMGSSSKNSLDIIISTVSANINWSSYFNLLKPRGRFVFVGLPEEKLQFKPFDLVGKEISISGSLIGSPNIIEDMLQVASKHNVTAQIQTWSIDKVNDAIKDFRGGKPNYRYVLKISHSSM